MTATTKKQLLFASATALLILAAVATLVARDMRRVGRGVGGFLRLATLGMAAQAQEDFELPGACEVVVVQEVDGRLSVFGRAVPKRVSVQSREELRSLLRSLPRRGAAIARVKEPTKAREIHLGPPTSPEARQAQAELTQLLVSEGFVIARVPGPKLLPLQSTPEKGRPTSR